MSKFESPGYSPSKVAPFDSNMGTIANEPDTARDNRSHPSFDFEKTPVLNVKRPRIPQWDEVSFVSRITYLWIIPFFRNPIKSFSFLRNMLRLPNFL